MPTTIESFQAVLLEKLIQELFHSHGNHDQPVALSVVRLQHSKLPDISGRNLKTSFADLDKVNGNAERLTTTQGTNSGRSVKTKFTRKTSFDGEQDDLRKSSDDTGDKNKQPIDGEKVEEGDDTDDHEPHEEPSRFSGVYDFFFGGGKAKKGEAKTEAGKICEYRVFYGPCWIYEQILRLWIWLTSRSANVGVLLLSIQHDGARVTLNGRYPMEKPPMIREIQSEDLGCLWERPWKRCDDDGQHCVSGVGQARKIAVNMKIIQEYYGQYEKKDLETRDAKAKRIEESAASDKETGNTSSMSKIASKLGLAKVTDRLGIGTKKEEVWLDVVFSEFFKPVQALLNSISPSLKIEKILTIGRGASRMRPDSEDKKQWAEYKEAIERAGFDNTENMTSTIPGTHEAFGETFLDPRVPYDKSSYTDRMKSSMYDEKAKAEDESIAIVVPDEDKPGSVLAVRADSTQLAIPVSLAEFQKWKAKHKELFDKLPCGTELTPGHFVAHIDDKEEKIFDTLRQNPDFDKWMPTRNDFAYVSLLGGSRTEAFLTNAANAISHGKSGFKVFRSSSECMPIKESLAKPKKTEGDSSFLATPDQVQAKTDPTPENIFTNSWNVTFKRLFSNSEPATSSSASEMDETGPKAVETVGDSINETGETVRKSAFEIVTDPNAKDENDAAPVTDNNDAPSATDKNDAAPIKTANFNGEYAEVGFDGNLFSSLPGTDNDGFGDDTNIPPCTYFDETNKDHRDGMYIHLLGGINTITRNFHKWVRKCTHHKVDQDLLNDMCACGGDQEQKDACSEMHAKDFEVRDRGKQCLKAYEAYFDWDAQWKAVKELVAIDKEAIYNMNGAALHALHQIREMARDRNAALSGNDSGHDIKESDDGLHTTTDASANDYGKWLVNMDDYWSAVAKGERVVDYEDSNEQMTGQSTALLTLAFMNQMGIAATKSGADSRCWIFPKSDGLAVTTGLARAMDYKYPIPLDEVLPDFNEARAFDESTAFDIGKELPCDNDLDEFRGNKDAKKT